MQTADTLSRLFVTWVGTTPAPCSNMHQIAEQPTCTFNVLDCHFFKLSHLKSWSRIRDPLAETPLFQPQEMPAHRDTENVCAASLWSNRQAQFGQMSGAFAVSELLMALQPQICCSYVYMISMMLCHPCWQLVFQILSSLVIVGQSGPSRMTFSAGNTKSFPEAQLGGVLHFSSPPQRHCWCCWWSIRRIHLKHVHDRPGHFKPKQRGLIWPRHDRHVLKWRNTQKDS